MSEYFDREFVAVPRLPLLTECAPLAAAVAGSSARRRRRPLPRYTDTTPPPGTDRAGTGTGTSNQSRPSWRFVRLRVGKSGHTVVEDGQQVEMSADEVPSTSACNPADHSRTATDSEPEPEVRQRQRRPEVTVSDASAGGVESGKLSTLESDVREVRRILQAYALRLSERDAHARVTKQWRLVARVLDRLFFFFYCATIVISLATIFPR